MAGPTGEPGPDAARAAMVAAPSLRPAEPLPRTPTPGHALVPRPRAAPLCGRTGPPIGSRTAPAVCYRTLPAAASAATSRSTTPPSAHRSPSSASVRGCAGVAGTVSGPLTFTGASTATRTTGSTTAR